MVERILDACCDESREFDLWLTGKGNFRFNYYPEYKANRIGARRPEHEQAVKDFLVEEFGARYTEGCEADDQVGALQTTRTIIAHIDKDINMIPGWHYHWGLTRKGKVLVEPHKYYVSPEEADYNFYYQMLVGDTTDNIKGVVGCGPVKAKELLSGNASEMFEVVRDAYNNDEYMLMTGRCLWIWRKMNDDILETWKQYDPSIG
jgi:hypothetical protein